MTIARSKRIVAIDLFCGVGGLTLGLEKSGIDVRLGIDIDGSSAYPIEENSGACFLEKNIFDLKGDELKSKFGNAEITLLAGCAPCQPFSTYSRAAKRSKPHSDWKLLSEFGRLVRETEPSLVTMENVPPLRDQEIFREFLKTLESYHVDFGVINGRNIGLPQNRKRLVLLASRLGPVTLPESNLPVRTVREAIGDLPRLVAGGSDPLDPLHCASRLSPLNLRRIQASLPGGTWRDWPAGLRAKCHERTSGATFPSVYGRMKWDAPAPTITTQCFGYGNGRFGHPDQDRAISLREAAMLQSFPRNYVFAPPDKRPSFSTLGRLIGNAVPVRLGKYIGDALVDHVAATMT